MSGLELILLTFLRHLTPHSVSKIFILRGYFTLVTCGFASSAMCVMLNYSRKHVNLYILTLLYLGETSKLNMFQSINNAMDIAMEKDPSTG